MSQPDSPDIVQSLFNKTAQVLAQCYKCFWREAKKKNKHLLNSQAGFTIQSMNVCVFTVQRDVLGVDCDCFPTVYALPTQWGFYLRQITANRDQEIPFLLGFCKVCETAPEHGHAIIKTNRNKRARDVNTAASSISRLH